MASYKVKMVITLETEVSVMHAKSEGDAQAQADILARRELGLTRSVPRPPKFLEFMSRTVVGTEPTLTTLVR